MKQNMEGVEGTGRLLLGKCPGKELEQGEGLQGKETQV